MPFNSYYINYTSKLPSEMSENSVKFLIMFFEELENVLTQNSFTPPNKSIAYLYLNWKQKKAEAEEDVCEVLADVPARLKTLSFQASCTCGHLDSLANSIRAFVLHAY